MEHCASRAYRYDDPLVARPWRADDGSRAISMFIFNTNVHLHVYAPEGIDAGNPAVELQLDDALEACRERCLFFERHLSRTRGDSDIARAHAAAPGPVDVARETAELVRLALGYCERSAGLFDITMGTVTALWDFHRGIVPSRLALARALPHVGYGKVCVGERLGPEGVPACPTLAIDDPETVVDLGGVAKGYIADDLARLLESHGVHRFALNLGGNVLVRGGRPGSGLGREPWRVGIADPFGFDRPCAVVSMTDGSAVTSGTRERRFSRGGRVYHHILSPVDGMPARTDAASATIVAPRSLDGDGYSTTVLMLGVERGLAFAEGLPGIEAVLVDETGAVRWTSGLDGRIAVSGKA